MIKRLDDTFEIEMQKGMNALEKSARPKTLEVTGIPLKDCENCIDIIYKICTLTSTNTKNQKLKSTT